MITIERYHDISCGHRVAGHENKCAHLHGHNYRITFKCEGELDHLGRVIDFSVIKEKLCNWLEDNFDHKFLMWNEDPLVQYVNPVFWEGFVFTPFNPTAENMAEYLCEVICPQQLKDTGVIVTSVRVEETRKCSAEYSL
jgi:6-pyruvoyltetrahydropterin/6-carboxytetrahydropterin synthase